MSKLLPGSVYHAEEVKTFCQKADNKKAEYISHEFQS